MKSLVSRLGIMIVMAAISTVGAAAEGPVEAVITPTYDGVTPAAPVVHFVPTFKPGTDPYQVPVPDHPPIDQIPPMPMPMPAGEDGEAFGPSDRSSTMYDATTGEAIQLPDTEASGAARFGGGFPPPFGDPNAPDESSFAGESFGSLSEITSQGSDPWRVNAKLVMEFETTGGATVWYVCSGSMQDPEVVLTASHCVYARDPNGNQIFDWAQEIWVYPGWDGSGSTGSTGTREYYGYARGSFYQASNSWINSGDFTYDVGLVRVNRAVGALTGSWGWAYGFSCGTVMGRSMYNVSYPAEGCGTPGLHNGRDMYFMSGTVDDCNTTNRFHIITTGGCFNAVWGGMSGSAMYYIDGGRYAEAVTSTSNRTTDAYYARLWDQFVTDMNDSFIPGARTGTFDLQALNAVASPTTITAGQSFSSASFFTTNPTNGSIGSTTFPLTARLSTNEILSTGDTLLQSTSYTRGYSAMQSATITFGSPPTIPLNTPSGNYWFGVVLDSSIDGVSSNNDTTYWDAQPVTVVGVADIVADWINAPSGSFNPGATIPLSYNIDNAGGDSSNSITVDIRASLNTTITTSDPQVAQYLIGGLGGSGTVTNSPSPSLPGGLAPGTYYIGMIISSTDDVNSSNNKAYDATPITVVDSAIFSDGFESGNTSAWSQTSP